MLERHSRLWQYVYLSHWAYVYIWRWRKRGLLIEYAVTGVTQFGKGNRGRSSIQHISSTTRKRIRWNGIRLEMVPLDFVLTAPVLHLTRHGFSKAFYTWRTSRQEVRVFHAGSLSLLSTRRGVPPLYNETPVTCWHLRFTLYSLIWHSDKFIASWW